MYHYRIFCLEVESDLEFLQLVRSKESRRADVTICKGNLDRNPDAPQDLHYEIGTSFSWLENATCYLRVENGSKITYRLKEGGNEKYLLSYILGWGFAMLAYQRNELAMHCSVVADKEGAVLICGESGCGKSTITTAFLASGYRFLADDMAFVRTQEHISYVKPAFPYQKLCRDAAMECGCPPEEMIYIDEMKDKFLVPYKGEFPDEPVRIKAMLLLYKCAGEEVCTAEITGIHKLHGCLNNLFLRKLLKEQKYAPAMGALGLAMAGSVPMYAIGRPEGRDTRKEVVEAALYRQKEGSRDM